MDYEQKYKEALERMKSWVRGEHPECFSEAQKAAEFIFPELAESEDERIRKKVIEVLKLNIKGAESQMQASRGVDRCFEIYACNKVIAWLKKQGKKQSIWSDSDRTMAFTLMRDVGQMTYISNEGKNERFQWLNSLEDKFNKGE